MPKNSRGKYQPKLGAYLRKDEIDPHTYAYTLASTPSRYWKPMFFPPPPKEVYSAVTVYDAEEHTLRRISKEDLQRRPGVGKIRHGSSWMGAAGWKARKAPKKGKYLYVEHPE